MALEDGDSAKTASRSGGLVYLGWNLLSGVLFYFLIVQHYPSAGNVEPNDASKRLQNENALTATLQSSCSTILHSWCCAPARLSLTLATLGVLNYWVSLILSLLAPCCLLCAVNTFTDLNIKLGGQKQNFIAACLCSCCCSCCLISQDAESLDRMLGLQGSVIGAPVKISA